MPSGPPHVFLCDFQVGCGALGCEFLKNFALVGLACGEKGMVTVTDNDRIEVQNLDYEYCTYVRVFVFYLFFACYSTLYFFYQTESDDLHEVLV